LLEVKQKETVKRPRLLKDKLVLIIYCLKLLKNLYLLHELILDLLTLAETLSEVFPLFVLLVDLDEDGLLKFVDDLLKEDRPFTINGLVIFVFLLNILPYGLPEKVAADLRR
jgi:hypothetical protein